MTNYFKIGLMALTLAFGVTSCDKQDNGGPAVSFLNAEIEGLTSKVTFGEDAGMDAPKGLKNLTAKNASEFTHSYGDADQNMTIKAADANGNATGVALFAGTYTPNQISSTLDPRTISLVHGKYIAETSNSSDLSATVLGFLPYTSEAVFQLSDDVTIQLQAELSRGFVIVDAENANDGGRITSVVFSETGITGNLIEDNDGDFYGYLEGGTYDVNIVYSLGDETRNIVTRSTIVNGQTLTINPELIDEPIVLSETVTTATVTSTEAVLHNGDGLNVNSDDDLLDIVQRTITTTTQFADGVLIPSTDAVVNPLVEESPWTLLSDIDTITVGEDVPDTTDADAAAAQDELDRIAEEARIEAERVAAEEAAAAAQAIIDAAAQVEADRLAAEAAATLAAEQAAALAATPDTLPAFSGDWSGTNPGFGDSDTREEGHSTESGAPTSQASLTVTYNFVTFMAGYTYQETRTREVMVNGDVDVPAPEGDLTESRNVVIDENIVSSVEMTREIANDAYVAPSDSNDGDVDAAIGTITIVNDNPSSLAGLITIVFNEGVTTDIVAGTYNIVVTNLSGVSATVTVDITDADLADGAVTVTVNTVANANTVTVS